MAFFGEALAHRLSTIRGLYSIQLPERLRQELLVLAARLNSTTPTRAVYVTDLTIDEPVFKSTWAEVLKWRTSDDRVFVWERSAGEPDSSFQSAVREFIGPRFPVAGELCDLQGLADLTVDYLFHSEGLHSSGEFYSACLATVHWIAEAYFALFKDKGSSADAHWTDQFLIEWAGFCDTLPKMIQAAKREGLQPRFAWDLIRSAGLIVPKPLAGNPFLSSPESSLPPHGPQLGKYVGTWQAICDAFIIQRSQLAILLNELDGLVQGAGNRTPWRDLAWGTIRDEEPESSVTELGRRIFLSSASPPVIAASPPTFPVAPAGAWWGVTQDDLDKVAESVRGVRTIRPRPDSAALFGPFTGTETYLLNTRTGTVSFPSTRAKWKCLVRCDVIALEFRERWADLFVTDDEPQEAAEGDAWLREERVNLKMSGRGASVRINGVHSIAGIMYVDGTISIEYSGSIDSASSSVTGSWDPERTLTLSIKIRDRLADGFGPEREIKSQMKLIVPSALSLTTLIVSREENIVSPSGDDDFGREGAETAWSSVTTPEAKLSEEGQYNVFTYNGIVNIGIGTFWDETEVFAAGVLLPRVTALTGLASGSVELSDGATVQLQRGSEQAEVAVVRIMEERPTSVSSAIVAALQGRPTFNRPPSSTATASLLGRYQRSIVGGICNALSSMPFESLFHVVVSSDATSVSWREQHPAGRNPLFIGESFPSTIPGIGNGPNEIFETSEWKQFSLSLEEVTRALGIEPTSHDAWLSGFDPYRIPSIVVKRYNQAHAKLIEAAKRISPEEAFWASYPFSVVVTNGEHGRGFGQLQAILLSPLHPVRLTWAHSLATYARLIPSEEAGRAELLGIAEGWNFPLVGYAPSQTGRPLTLVAVPIDPGPDRDFIQWSALALLTNNLLDTPPKAAGLPLPWAGRSGINDKVVERALDDYLKISPFTGAMVVDLRSVAKAPRSKEIDEAVLQYLTDTSNPLVASLAGGSRVFDSQYREGMTPSRDDLLSLRGDDPEGNVAFEWQTYEPQSIPVHADVAFVENAGVSLDVISGSTPGLIGALPLRRTMPADNHPGRLDQNFVPDSGDDIFALAPLLHLLEAQEGSSNAALRSSPTLDTLGIAKGAKWEIIGTFNISPRLIARTLSGASTDKLLWEWRPSWLNPEKRAAFDPARRPFYVVAKIPASLSVGLASRQGLSPDQIRTIISELGSRAVGLATLYASGFTNESAAAGFFYALQLLAPTGSAPPASWIRTDPWYQSIIPIDPLAELLAALASKKFQRRADLLTIGCARINSSVHLCLGAVEVKHHGTPSDPEARPSASNPELRRAREQLKETVDVLGMFRDGFHDIGGRAALAVGKRTALSILVDFALDFATRPIDARQRYDILKDILEGRCSISIATPLLLWFAPGSIALNGAAIVHGTHAEGGITINEAFIDPYAVPGLWWKDRPLAPDDNQVRSQIDEIMSTVIGDCIPSGATGEDVRPALESLLQMEDQPQPSGDASGVEQILGTGESRDPQSVEEIGTPPSAEGPVIDEPVPEPRVDESPVAEQPAPELVVGSRQLGVRWTILGNLVSGPAQVIALDLDQPKIVGIFGYMGSGKSYLLGTITEAAVKPLPNLNQLASPLAVVIFNYRRNASDRFELSSLVAPNTDVSDVARLQGEFSARPSALEDVLILTLRGELTPERLAEYSGIEARELLFRPASLHVDDWELLMGVPGVDSLYAQQIRHSLIELRDHGEVSLDGLRQRIAQIPNPASRNAADQRLVFAERHVSQEHGINFADIVKPGRVLIVDLRQPLFNKDDALRFFLVCANQISRIQGQFNKMIIFDEAHEYLSGAFGDKLDSRIRQMRHEGTSYVFATQDTSSIPREIQRHISTKFVFGLGSHQNVEDLEDFAPEFKGFELIELPPGQCLVQATMSPRNFFLQPRPLKVRPRATSHGGGTRIFH